MSPVARTLLSRVPRTVLGTLVARFRSTARRRASGARSGNVGAGFLTPPGLRSGLGGPMPRTITLVVRGRCRPSPDRVSEGASPDRDARRIVPGQSCGSWRGQWFLPVLGAPPAGVGGVDRDDRDVLFGGHRHQPGLQLRGGEAGDAGGGSACCGRASRGLCRRGSRGPRWRSRQPRSGGCSAAAGSGRAGSARPGAAAVPVRS